MLTTGYTIRRAGIKDRTAIRRISCETSFLDYPRNLIFDDDEILADILTLYFTDYEPDSCLVAISGNDVIGYLIGSTDVNKMGRIRNSKIIIPLFIKATKRGVFFRKHNLKFLFSILKSLLKGEFYHPDFAEKFPATLHINLVEEFRGKGIGRKLIETYQKYLKEEGVRGIHFSSFSEEAKNFFLKIGFTILFQGKRRYLKPYLGKEINFYVFGKELLA